MRPELELKLIHDGRYWVVSNGDITARGEDFESLDRDLIQTIRRLDDFSNTSAVDVFMGFDFDTIPTWLRQYHTHYFNRRVTLEF